MARTVSDTYERIDRLLTGAERRIRRLFLTAALGLRDSIDLEALEALLASGDLEGAVDMLRGVAQALGAESSVVFATAGQDTARFLAAAGVAQVSFDQVNERAVRIMRESSLGLIRQFTDGQRDVVRDTIRDGIARGIGPRDQARAFRDVVGLTARQAGAVRNYRRLLEQAGNGDTEALTRELRDRRFDAAVRRAARTRRAIPKAKIDQMVARYQARYIKHRAEVIARTEALRAVHQGVEEAYAQAVEDGKLILTQLEEVWNSARDTRVRDSHQRLNGTKRPEGGKWQGATGALRYPGDPEAPASEVIQCRCVLTRRIKPAQGGLALG